MKLFEITQEKREYSVSLCGFSLYTRKIDDKRQLITIKLFKNLFIFTQDIALHTEKLKIYNISIFKTKLKGSYKKYSVLGIPILFKNIEQQFYIDFMDKILANGGDFDDCWVFICRSGEFFLLMQHMDELLRRHGGGKTLFVFTAKFHIDICRMFFPDINYIYITDPNIRFVSHFIQSIKNTYKGKNIFFPFYEKYFKYVEQSIQCSNTHYYDHIKNQLSIYDPPCNLNISKSSLNKSEKIAKYLLNNHFVFICPETHSSRSLEKDFWEELCQKIKKMGYEIFCNSMNFNSSVSGAYSVFLSHEEAIALSKYATCIIGMRSGFLECLSQSRIPIIAIYTNFFGIPPLGILSSADAWRGFSITHLPHVHQDMIFELDANATMCLQDDILSILSKFK